MVNCLVLLSTYNGEKYLEDLLDSVLTQKNVNVDLLVRDDGSSDSTIDILKRYEGKHVKIYRGANLKPAKSFLDLIHSAPLTYDYYALCDQDDVWKINKLEKAVKMLENISAPALYSGAVEITNQRLENAKLSIHQNTFSEPLFGILTFGTPGCTFVFNKSLLQNLKEYTPAVCSMHDSWISFVCLATGGKFVYDKESYIYYRQHDGNVLGAQRHSLVDTFKDIIFYKGIRRSDMAKGVLQGYKKKMMPDVEDAFSTFAYYRKSIRCKVKLLCVPYQDSISRRSFIKVKLRVLFNAI